MMKTAPSLEIRTHTDYELDAHTYKVCVNAIKRTGSPNTFPGVAETLFKCSIRGRLQIIVYFAFSLVHQYIVSRVIG